MVRHRIGMEFSSVSEAARAALIEYCAITHYVDEAAEIQALAPSQFDVKHSHPRATRAFSLTAVTLGLGAVFFGPASPAAFADIATPATACLATSTGDPLAGAAVSAYYDGSWHDAAKTGDDGCTVADMPPRVTTVAVTYGGIRNTVKQDLGENPMVNFATVPVTVTLTTSTGDPSHAPHYPGWTRHHHHRHHTTEQLPPPTYSPQPSATTNKTPPPTPHSPSVSPSPLTATHPHAHPTTRLDSAPPPNRHHHHRTTPHHRHLQNPPQRHQQQHQTKHRHQPHHHLRHDPGHRHPHHLHRRTHPRRHRHLLRQRLERLRHHQPNRHHHHRTTPHHHHLQNPPQRHQQQHQTKHRHQPHHHLRHGPGCYRRPGKRDWLLRRRLASFHQWDGALASALDVPPRRRCQHQGDPHECGHIGAVRQGSVAGSQSDSRSCCPAGQRRDGYAFTGGSAFADGHGSCRPVRNA